MKFIKAESKWPWIAESYLHCIPCFPCMSHIAN